MAGTKISDGTPKGSVAGTEKIPVSGSGHPTITPALINAYIQAQTSGGIAEMPVYTVATRNWFWGTASGNLTLTGADNYAFGPGSLYSLTSGSYNTSIGYYGLQLITAGSDNFSGGGHGALASATGFSAGNFATNFHSLYLVTDVNQTIGMGRYAAQNCTGALFGCTFIGPDVAGNLTGASTGSIIMGNGVDAPAASGNGMLNLQNALTGLANNGTTSTISTGQLGLYTFTPGTLNTVDFTGITQFHIKSNKGGGVTSSIIIDAGSNAYVFFNNSANSVDSRVWGIGAEGGTYFTINTFSDAGSGLSKWNINRLGQVVVGAATASESANTRYDIRGMGTTTGKTLRLANSSSTENYAFLDNGNNTSLRTVTAGGTTGAQTIDKPSGSVNFAGGATTLVVTNALVTASTGVFCVIGTDDTTATIKNVVCGAGSFTIKLTAAATAETKVYFYIHN